MSNDIIVNMDGSTLSGDSTSSDSEDERPSFGTTVHHDGFETGGQKRSYHNASLNDVFSENAAKKRRVEASDTTAKKKCLEGSGKNEDGCKRTFDDASFDDGFTEPPAKKKCLEGPGKVQRMMEMMGYKEGAGLGKHGQGRLEPVEAFKPKGKRGLGYFNAKLQDAYLKWNPDDEIVAVQEDLVWLNNSHNPITAQELSKWMGIGPAKETINDETNFCDQSVVEQVINAKSVFDNLNKNEMRRARRRSNPFETIRGAFFLNRAAVKMANIDKACNFMFTHPKTLKSKELLYFADVCAGPGGFSEYVLWRKKWHAKGFGFTLKESNDFQLDDFYAGSPDTFHPYYGPNEDGDVYSPENQEEFRQLIMSHTNFEGVHFMMSDGGFSVDGKETIQEILSKQLYLCQCLVALMIVREGGHFVTKLFDLFTPFSAGLVYLMYRCFKCVTIFKPNTSRPANSERYLICKGKHSQEEVQSVIDYLARANRVILQNDKNRDVLQLVPLETLQEDEQFFQYLVNSNNSLGRKQIVGLLKIAAFYDDPDLVELRQGEIRKQCLEYWNLPDKTRTIPWLMKPDERMKAIFKNSTPKFFASLPKQLTATENVNTLVGTAYDWFCMACGSGEKVDEKSASFYMGTGRTKTFRYDKGSWTRILNVELPPDTLVYAEMVSELRGEHRQQRKTTALHILDAYLLGGQDVSHFNMQDRYEWTKMFCEALWKPFNGGLIRVRAKEIHSLTDHLENKLRLKICVMKNGTRVLGHYPSTNMLTKNALDDEPYFFVPNSILFVKATARNWSRHVSRSTGYPYYFNCRNKDTFYDKHRPDEASAAFPETFETRMIWHWPPDPSLTLGALAKMIDTKWPVPLINQLTGQ